MEELPDLLTFLQVAKILSVHISTVGRYTKRSEYPLPVVYLNPQARKSPRIKKADLKEWMEQLEDPRQDI